MREGQWFAPALATLRDEMEASRDRYAAAVTGLLMAGVSYAEIDADFEKPCVVRVKPDVFAMLTSVAEPSA